MGNQREHPHLLLWYVSGDLDPRQARETEAHLARCADCATEARALASMLEIMRRDYPGGPPVAPRRPGSAAGSPGPAARWRDGARMSESKLRALKRGAVVAAGLLVIAAPLLVTRWNARQDSLTIREVQPVTFASPQRGAAGERVLRGDGPWAVTVVLPFGAPEGRYHVSIERKDEPALSAQPAIVSSDGQGRLSVVLDSLPQPGRYFMTLSPLEGGADSASIYEFTAGTVPREAP
ncbi:MAG TPA: zf-HC2 domain-containing protein [Candidatus Polarisedimenticolia bacterium]